MTVFQAAVLGLIQGLAEFLPVSSSGHLVLAGTLFGIKEGSLELGVLLHLGTLVPVIIVLRKEILAIIKKPFQKMTGLLVIGTMPAVAAALISGDRLDALFSGGYPLGLGFIVTGVFLLYADKRAGCTKNENEITYADAAVAGLMQAAAVAPGVSRSGSVVAGALGRGISREAAARFSFLLSIPAILGGAVFSLKDILTEGSAFAISDAPALAAGFIAAAASGYFAVRAMLRLVVKAKLKYFSYYVFALGAFVIVINLISK